MKSQVAGENFSLINSSFKNKTIDIPEILVFECGYGESILIRTDTGKYIVVDSFINTETGNPIAIDYLKSVNESLNKIKCIVVTHFHDDHIKGITTIIKEASDAEVVLNPIAFKSRKVLNYIAETQTIDGIQNHTTSEAFRLINFLEKNNVKRTWAISNRIIYSDEDSENFSIESLSPHDESIDKHLLSIENSNFDIVKNFIKLENLMSVVLLVRSKNCSILLGGDCTSEDEPFEGWETICTKFSKRAGISRVKADTFKIPHHGSATGQCERVWDEVLIKNPISVLTSFNKGKKVPNDLEIEWILSKTDKLYIVGNIKKNDELYRQLKKAGAITENEIYYNQGKTGIFKCSYINKSEREYEFNGYVKKITAN